ncbi:MAG: CDP-alcohol phosphatidyltransferase family protein [Acidobacteriota bacterium]
MDAIATPVARRAAHANPIRLQNSVLNTIEKRTLIWLAHRIPAFVTSDHLTILALMAMVGAGLSYWSARATPFGLWLVIAFLAINWFGDSLDGTLARVRQQPRPRFGYYVDHVVDAVGAVCLFGGLAASGFMSAPVAAVLLIAYFLLCLEVYLATVSLGEFRMSFFGVGPTELRILLAVGNVVLLVHPTVVIAGHAFKLFDVGGVVGAAGLLGTFMFATIRNTRTLYREEPLPPRGSR